MQRRASPSIRLTIAGVLAILTALSSACASSNTAGTPRPLTPASMGRPVEEAPTADAIATPASTASKTMRGVVDTAMSLRGIRYRTGGTTRDGFDCSGFTMYVFGQHGIDLPRSTADQYREGKAIKHSEIKAGDLLFFKTVGKEVTHVAISIDGEQFVHAPSSTGVVRVESLDTTYWASRFLGARRVE